MAHAQVEGFVGCAVFRVIANGVGGSAIVADLAVGGIQVGALGQAVGVANSPLISVICSVGSAAISTDVRRDELVCTKRDSGAKQIVAALTLPAQSLSA